jgi:hypothetical protein
MVRFHCSLICFVPAAAREDLRFFFFDDDLECECLRRRNDLAVSAAIKMATPSKCSHVQTLLKRKKDKNKVVALRAVLVILMVSAPKFFVMAAEQDEPKNPMLENKIMTNILPLTDHVVCNAPLVNSLYVPGCDIHTSPSRKSPLAAAAAVMATSAIEYMRKMNYIHRK